MKPTKWVLDPFHSEVQFKVKHLMISTITGQFNTFEATVETNTDDFTSAKAFFKADTNSINTSNNQRDSHLKNSEFLDAENYPHLTFQTDRIEKGNDDEYTILGVLTMKGISKPVVLNAEFGGITEYIKGEVRAGFSLSGKINRKDFGVSYSQLTEKGGIVVGDEVRIIANVEFVKQQDI